MKRERIPKPYYFEQRYNSSTGKKKQYYKERLQDMGINITKDKIIGRKGADMVILKTDYTDKQGQFYILRLLNWKTGEVEQHKMVELAKTH